MSVQVIRNLVLARIQPIAKLRTFMKITYRYFLNFIEAHNTMHSYSLFIKVYKIVGNWNVNQITTTLYYEVNNGKTFTYSPSLSLSVVRTVFSKSNKRTHSFLFALVWHSAQKSTKMWNQHDLTKTEQPWMSLRSKGICYCSFLCTILSIFEHCAVFFEVFFKNRCKKLVLEKKLRVSILFVLYHW